MIRPFVPWRWRPCFSDGPLAFAYTFPDSAIPIICVLCFAVMLTLDCHFFRYLPGAWLGPTIYFVISTYHFPSRLFLNLIFLCQ
jgi:hypothetical protein